MTITKGDLQRFSGSGSFIRHGLNRNVIYTEGMLYLAEEGEAFWLIDAIASYITPRFIKRAAAKDYRAREMLFWKLLVQKDSSAVLTARVDSDCDPIVSQEIPYTDFPLQEVDVWSAYNGQGWTLYLPSEH